MLDIPTFKHYDNEKRIAILDNSSIVFFGKNGKMWILNG